jgi:prepilin-type N-terminal cleavage/methylation domain-containing protein
MIQMDMIRPQTRRQRGFTMLELLVVIGVILVLISLMFIGLKYVSNQGRAKDTVQALQIAKTLLANYENATQLRLPSAAIYPNPPGYVPPSGASFAASFWTDQFPLQQGTSSNYQSSLNIIVGNVTQGLSDQGDLNLVHRTLVAMQLFMSIPENATLINNLPQGKTVMVTLLNTSITPAPQVPILLDGWGNPIYFVPSGGVANVLFSGDTNYPPTSNTPTWHVISSSGTHGSGYTGASSDRPFFMSGGPDDDVSRGDDNVYSFGN